MIHFQKYIVPCKTQPSQSDILFKKLWGLHYKRLFHLNNNAFYVLGSPLISNQSAMTKSNNKYIAVINCIVVTTVTILIIK